MDQTLENTFANKTLVGNWNEDRTMNGLVSVPANGRLNVTTYNTMCEQNPITGLNQIKSAGFSRAKGASINSLDRTWSSLSLKPQTEQSDNQFLTTTEKAYNRGKSNAAGFGYGTRKWNITRGHWLPESVETSTHTSNMMYGVLDARNERIAKREADLNWMKLNKPTTYSIAYKDRPVAHAYPSRMTRTTLAKSTQMYPINKYHRDFVLRNARLVNVVPDFK